MESSGRPSPITLGTLVPYVRRHVLNTEANRFGWLVAHHDVIEQASRHGIVSEVHLFSLPMPGMPQDWRGAALSELRTRSRAKVLTLDISQLGDRVAKTNYVFLCKSSGLAHVAQLRLALADATFPICSILHAVHTPDLLASIICTLVTARPGDAIVATSRAANRAFADIIAQTTETIRWAHTSRHAYGDTPLVLTIPLAIEDTILNDAIDTREARRTLGLDVDTTVALWVGRFTEHYKADLAPLLAVLRDLERENVRLHLLLAGQESHELYGRQIEQCVRALGLDRRVTVLTSFQPFLKRVLYGAADIFLSPVDNIQESFGLTVIEAMARGLPVIASDWSGYRDIVVDGETGVLVRTLWASRADRLANQLSAVGRIPDAEGFLAARTVVDTGQLKAAIKGLTANPERRRTMGLNGRGRVLAHYVWSKVVKQYEELWRELLDRSRGSRVPETNGGLHIERAFRHYASATLGDHMKVRPSGHAADLLRGEPGPLLSPPADLSRETILGLLSSATDGQDVATLAGAQKEYYDAVRWLLKKGYLELEACHEEATDRVVSDSSYGISAAGKNV